MLSSPPPSSSCSIQSLSPPLPPPPSPEPTQSVHSVTQTLVDEFGCKNNHDDENKRAAITNEATISCTSDKNHRNHSENNDRKRKRVRISEDPPTSMPSSSSSSSSSKKATTTTTTDDRIVISDHEKAMSWWSSNEIARSKASVKRQCRDDRKNRQYSECLSETYRRACILAQQEQQHQEHQQRQLEQQRHCHQNQVTKTLIKQDLLRGMSSYSNSGICNIEHDNDNDHDSIRRLQKKDDRKHGCYSHYPDPDVGLVQWIQDFGQRGLEGLSSRLHAIRRHRHIQESKHAVLVEQARQNLSKQRCCERIARKAEIASRRARQFACLLGHADAWVANLEYNNDNSKESDHNLNISFTTTSRNQTTVEVTNGEVEMDEKNPRRACP